MNKLRFAIITLLYSISVSYSQIISPDGKKPIPRTSTSPLMTESSQVRNSGLNTILSAGGDVFIGGYNTEFEEGKVRGYGLLVRISKAEMTIKRLPFVPSVDEMVFIDDSKGWFMARGVGVFKTTDRGDSWQELCNSSDISGSIFYLNDDLGWYFGIDEYLKRIEGNSVQKMKFFDKLPYIRKLQFTSGDYGWLSDVVNGSPRFERTKDGGATWEMIDINDFRGVSDFQFLTDSEGFAVTAEGLYFTSDYGESWNIVKKQPAKSEFTKLFFLNRNIGWIIGPGRSCFTADGGSKWSCSSSIKELNLKSINRFVFTDINNGWMLAGEGLYFTTDSGRTWQRRLIIFEGTTF